MASSNHNGVLAHERNIGRYGKDSFSRTCSKCQHLISRAGRDHRCGLIGGGPTFEWRAEWAACGAIDLDSKNLLR